MKKIGAILTTLALVLVLATGASFASTLELESSYPEDGSTGASIENMSVKLYFNGSMSEEKAGKANDDNVFQLYDAEGKKVPTRTLYGSSEEGVVLVLLDTSKDVEAESNSEYTLKISGDLVDDEGNQLGKDQKITFKTLNEQVNTWVSMAMMVVMFGGMMIASMKGVAKAAEGGSKQPKDEKVNPYKEAKKTGKSVEEIVEADQKKKAKEAAKAAKKAAKEAAEMEEEDNGNYKVHVKRSAGAAGSSYVAAKREATAKAKAEEEKRKAAAKNAKKKKK